MSATSGRSPKGYKDRRKDVPYAGEVVENERKLKPITARLMGTRMGC